MTNTPTLHHGYLETRSRPLWFQYALALTFACALSVPLFGLGGSQGEVSPFENRRVQERPALEPRLALLRAYPAAFERWFNDNFGSRVALTRLDHWVRAVALRTSPVAKVLIGRDGWLYFTGEDARALDRYYRGIEPLSNAEVRALYTELERRRAFLASKGIAYLVVVAPDKYSVYPEFLPSWVQKLSAQTALDRISEEMQRHPDLHFIDLRSALIAAKSSEQLYFKTDSHWNYAGARVAYRVLMTEVARLLPGVEVAAPPATEYVPGKDRYSGDLSTMLGLPGRFSEDDVAPLGKVLAASGARCPQRVAGIDTPGFETYGYRCERPPQRTALVYRDSMAISLIPMLSENFARVTYVSSRKLDRALVDRLHPDIVIEELVERSLEMPAALPM
jgi:hypothetical protein